jgi:eukaryotic-like serine/threonine-protein kinase
LAAGVRGQDRADPCLDEEEAAAYVQHRLDPAARGRVDAHIDRCAECGWLVSELARGSRSDASPGAASEAAGEDDEDDVLSPGRQVGRYVVGERLGSGAMGVVHTAYDPELDRRVAIKVVRPDAAGDEQARARLLVEARAMARLSHPGVVPVHDVGTLGRAVFIAMELVDGQDARRWLERERPGWRKALATLGQAGRGLAAAHAAGIVHRDVKPANILVGLDGGSRITDFGLARAAARDDEELARGSDPGGSGSSLAFTRSGALVGTPAYMAPELFRGGRADARSDQFSFSVLLHEAVYGARPFAAADRPLAPIDAVAAEIIRGAVRSPPAGSRVPAWLRRILLRGLAVDPDSRWPSLSAMLDALAETPRRRRRRWLAAGGALVAGALAAGWLARPAPAVEESCTGGAAALTRAWDPSARRNALARLAGLGAYGRALAPRLEAQLGEHAASWVTGYRDACLAHRGGAQSAELLDRRMACLERGRLALAAVAEILATAERSTLPQAALAVRSLPEPAACADVDAMLAPIPPPAPAIAARASTVEGAIERAQVHVAAGRFADARTSAAAAVAGARELGYQPLLARALLVEGRAGMGFEDPTVARPALAEATSLALAVGDDALAVEAWARRAWVDGLAGQDPDRALAGQDVIAALATRTPSAGFARALLYNNLGAIAFSRGRRDEARAWHERALAEARRVTGPGAIELVNVRANAASTVDDPVRRDALLADVEADLARLVGADHPEALSLRVRRAMWIPDLAAARGLLTSACDAYERYHRDLGAAPILECWSELGFVAEELGDRAAALAAMERAAALSPDGEAGGYAALWRGDAATARERFERALAASDGAASPPLWIRFERGKLGVGLGIALRSAGAARPARAALERAIADLDEVRRAQPAAVVERRWARGRAELAGIGASRAER